MKHTYFSLDFKDLIRWYHQKLKRGLFCCCSEVAPISKKYILDSPNELSYQCGLL